MTALVRVYVDQMPMGVRLQLVNDHGDGGYSITTFGSIGKVHVSPEDAMTAPTPLDADLRLMPDEARALYEALAEHYGHTANNTRQLRADYDAERRRVDKLTDAVIQMAGTPPTIIDYDRGRTVKGG